MSLHAKLSASGSARWINCPGSVAAESGLPESRSAFADEGTCAHELAELTLINGWQCSDLVGKRLVQNNAHVVSQEMADYVQVYVDYVRSLKGEHSYEQRLDFSEWVPNGFGTSDAVVISGDTVHIVDLKYGKGLRVDAEQNTQAMLYALGVVSDFGAVYDIKNVNIAIVQPRLDHISEWSISYCDLMAWGEWVSQRAEEATSPDAKRVPGEKQCQFCRAKATCKAQSDHAQRILMADFDTLDELAPVNTLSDERLSEILAAKKLIVSWLEAVEDHISEKLNSGQDFPGWKLVSGRSLRVWADESEAAKRLSENLGDDAFTRKIISPAQAEKLLGKSRLAVLDGIVSKPEGKPTLAPASDPRPSVTIKADDFDACV